MIERRRIGIAMNLHRTDPSATDAVLVTRIAAGDASAFGELYRRRRGDAYRFALHTAGSPPAAEDVSQEESYRESRRVNCVSQAVVA
jgi:hypothetical protein